MKIWKRNAVVSTIVLFVCVALYLSWSYSRVPSDEEGETVFDPGTKTSIETEPDDVNTDITPADIETTYFDEARLTRKRARENALAILTDATERTDASQAIRDNAAKEIETMAKNSLLEANIESLVIAKGFSECVAIINSDGISVIVSEPEGGLTPGDAAKIKDIVIDQTALTASNITIAPVTA